MLTPATITVTFTANYAGLHRICWRQCGVGPFVCTNLVDCVGGGNVCSATVSIMVDPESCDPVCFEGYIQATCNPEGSAIDQVPWTATFTPNPACKMFSLTCTLTCDNPPQLCALIPAVAMGLNCNGTVRPDVQLFCGRPIYLCATGVIPNLPVDYVMAPFDGCCYDCTEYDITITPACPIGCVLDGSSLYYIDCTTRELVRQDFTGNSPVVISGLCAVTGSVSLQLTPEALGTVTAIGPCP